MDGPDDHHTTEADAAAEAGLRKRTRAVALGSGALLLIPAGLTLTSIVTGQWPVGPLLTVWSTTLVVVALGWWGLRRQKRMVRDDPRAVDRRQVDKRARRVYLFGGPLAYLVGNVTTAALGLEGPERWAVLVLVLLVALGLVHVIAQRFDPRVRLWGAPRPLSDEELAARDADTGSGRDAGPRASAAKPW